MGSVECNSLVKGLMLKALVVQTQAAHARQFNDLDQLFEGVVGPEASEVAAAARREAEEATAVQAKIKAAAEKQRAAFYAPLVSGLFSGNEAEHACEK